MDASPDRPPRVVGGVLLATIPLVWTIHGTHVAAAVVLGTWSGKLVVVAWTVALTAWLIWTGIATLRSRASDGSVATAATMLFVPAGTGGLTAVHLWSLPLFLASVLVLAAALFCLGQIPRPAANRNDGY